MSAVEREARAARDCAYVERNTTSAWAERVLIDMKTHKKEFAPQHMTYTGVGLGLGYRHVGIPKDFRVVDVDHVAAAYRTSPSIFRRESTF